MLSLAKMRNNKPVTSNSVMDFKEDTDSGMVLGTLEEAVSP